MKSIYLAENHPPGRLLRYARKDKKTNLASSFGGSVGNADDRGLYVILSAAKYPTTKVKSICTVSSSVGFFTIVQNDVILLPSREFASSLRFLAKTVKFLCHRERSVAIPLRKYAICTPFFIPTDCRGTSCLAMTTSRSIVRWDISLTLNMTYFFYLSLRAAGVIMPTIGNNKTAAS